MSRPFSVEVVEFEATDGFLLNLVHCFDPSATKTDPVLVVHGAGVRSGVFQPPTETTFVDALVASHFDVWLLNWRASIELPPNEWTLEQAAFTIIPQPFARCWSAPAPRR